MRYSAICLFFLGELSHRLLHDGDGIVGICERIEPAFLDLSIDDFFDDRVSEVILVFKVMKERAFGGAGLAHVAIDAAALEAVLVKFIKSSFQDFAPCAFGFSTHACLHAHRIQTSRYVSMFNFYSKPLQMTRFCFFSLGLGVPQSRPWLYGEHTEFPNQWAIALADCVADCIRFGVTPACLMAALPKKPQASRESCRFYW